MEYLPSGVTYNHLNYSMQPYRFCGKEEVTLHGFDMYDSQARWQYPLIPRFSTMDPLAVNYYHLSPYAYCAGDPVNLMDPDGRLFGDFVDNKGRIIGNDGINDGKVYILKVSKDEIFENSINGSEYSLEELQNAKSFVKDYSGNADVFLMKPDVYDYFVEVVGNKELRQEMVNIVGHDNGVRSHKEDNRREYGGYVIEDKVTMATPGKIDAGTINLRNTSTTFHSHPSGIDPNTNKVFYSTLLKRT